MIVPLSAIGLMFVSALMLYWYVRPPQITPVSKETLADILSREGKKGDTFHESVGAPRREKSA